MKTSEQNRLQSFIKNHKYKFNIWLLILPFYFLYQSLNPVFPPVWDAQTLGEFEFAPMPFDTNPPYSHHGTFVKDFMVMVNKGDISAIRQAYLNIGPEALPLQQMQLSDEGILHGSQHGQHAHALAPAQITEQDRLWLTVQDWQMNVQVIGWDIPTL